MERIKTIATRDLTKSVKTGGCGECQTSFRSRSCAAAKTTTAPRMEKDVLIVQTAT